MVQTVSLEVLWPDQRQDGSLTSDAMSANHSVRWQGTRIQPLHAVPFPTSQLIDLGSFMIPLALITTCGLGTTKLVIMKANTFQLSAVRATIRAARPLEWYLANLDLI